MWIPYLISLSEALVGFILRQIKLVLLIGRELPLIIHLKLLFTLLHEPGSDHFRLQFHIMIY